MGIYTEASLSDSQMFQTLNKSSNLSTRIATIIKTGTTLSREYIEEQYMMISRTRLSPLSEHVLQAFDNQQVRLIYNNQHHLTQALPFVILTVAGKTTACIFIADYSPMNKEGTMLTMEMKKLYTLMEAAYVGLHFFTNPSGFTRSSTIAKVGAHIYAEMGLRILNREYALSLDKDVFDTVNYILARYFLSKVLLLPSDELCNAYARAVCKSPADMTISLASDMYESNKTDTVQDLIDLLTKSYPKMATLTFRYYFERWISSFGTGATLAIDSFPYFYYVIANVLLGSFLINVTGLSDVVKNTPGITQYYAEISRIC